MRTLRYSLILGVAAALFALPAAAQTSKKMTPARNTTCDDVNYATPGLYGLCVAMCEAQTCDAEYDANNDKVVYDPSCSPSTEQLFNNYRKIYEQRGDPADPAVPPCVKLACPCWTELELDSIAGPSAGCSPLPADRDKTDWMYMDGKSTDGPGWEWAFVSDDRMLGLMCSSMNQNPRFNRVNADLSRAVYEACLQSVVDECAARGR